MARPTDPEKRELFLAVALRQFARNGVNNTSTAEIARAAGTAAGTLFLYFPTKLDLIHALVLKISREQSEAINARLDPAFSARQMFWTIWHGSLTWFRDHPDAYLYILQVRDSGMIAEHVAQESSQFLRYYHAAVQKGLAEQVIQPYPPELIGAMLYQDVVAVMNLIRQQPDPATQDGYIDQGFEIFWNGIKTQE